MGSFGTHRRSVSIMFYILGLTLCSVFRATEIDRTVRQNTEEEEMEREEGGRGAEQEIVNIKMECCPISQMSSKCLESWRVMDEGREEALVELRQKEGGLARANGEIS